MDPWPRRQCAGDQPIARQRLEILRPGAQILKIERARRAAGEHEGAGPGAVGFRNCHLPIGSERFGGSRQRGAGFLGKRLREIPVRYGDTQFALPGGER